MLLVTAAIYARTAGFDFVDYDDAQYALTPQVRHGFTAESVRWAFLSTDISNWLPLTRLSFILDYSLFAARSGPRHGENLLLHMAASLAVFGFLIGATRARWPSAFVSLMFAVHPLHVESVAWIAERKDVLCGLFWFLALWAWTGYVRDGSRRDYALALVFFCLGVLSKPMIVTLPVVLLLLDGWPFRRPITAATLIEKTPFAVLSAGLAVVTFLAQKGGGAVESLERIGLWPRIGNAFESQVVYVAKTAWPSGLAVWYPYDFGERALAVAACGAAILAVSVAAFGFRRRCGYLATGWFWYLITTLPVIGIVQVGMQARADRYMYIPMTGLGIAVAWGASDLVGKLPGARLPVVAAAAVSLAAFSAGAWTQAGYWRDSVALFSRTIAVTQGNYIAWQNLGAALIRIPGRGEEAIRCFRTAAELRPGSAGAHATLCGALWNRGRAEEGLRECDIALGIEPGSWIAHDNKAGALASLGRTEPAIAEYRAAIAARPTAAAPHSDLGALLLAAHRASEALAEDEAALRIDPDMVAAHYNKGSALLNAGAAEAAVKEFEEALRLEPDDAKTHNILGAALTRVPGRFFDGIRQFEEAVRLDPSMAPAHFNLARALAEAGRVDEALAQIRTAVRLRPEPQSLALLADLEKRSREAN
jgi:tetratricopeptide (TPR) repeat protein